MPSDYIRKFQEAILSEYGCASIHSATAHVTELPEGETEWTGIVEVFDIDHPKAKKCYAWECHGTAGPILVLEIPPIHSPATALGAAWAARMAE